MRDGRGVGANLALTPRFLPGVSGARGAFWQAVDKKREKR